MIYFILTQCVYTLLLTLFKEKTLSDQNLTFNSSFTSHNLISTRIIILNITNTFSKPTKWNFKTDLKLIKFSKFSYAGQAEALFTTVLVTYVQRYISNLSGLQVLSVELHTQDKLNRYFDFS